MNWQFALVLVAYLHLCSSDLVSYQSYHEYRISPKTAVQIESLNNMSTTASDMYFLHETSAIDRDNVVIVAPHKLTEFSTFLRDMKMDFVMLTDNVQKLIDDEQQEKYKRSTEFNWYSYQNLEHIYKWLDNLAAKYSGIVTVINVGKSHEGRDIKVVKISHKRGNPSIVIEGGIHAREWIVHTTTTFIINELLSSTNAAVRNVAESFDWYIIPVFNVDGYVYTYTGDRMWRKNRRPLDHCNGVDLNRNFKTNWGLNSRTCDETYPGAFPESEKETRALSEFLYPMKNSIAAYVSLHCCGQWLLYPYSYTSTPNWNYGHHERIGKMAVKAMANRYGTKYTLAPIWKMASNVNGNSIDWAFDYLNVSLVFVYELRGNNFILPVEQIIPTGLETLDSVVVIAEEAKKLWPM